MARKTIKDRRATALAAMEEAKKKLAEIETAEALRIGKIAIKSGLADLDISDDELLKEFGALASKFQDTKPVQPVPVKATTGEG